MGTSSGDSSVCILGTRSFIDCMGSDNRHSGPSSPLTLKCTSTQFQGHLCQFSPLCVDACLPSPKADVSRCPQLQGRLCGLSPPWVAARFPAPKAGANIHTTCPHILKSCLCQFSLPWVAACFPAPKTNPISTPHVHTFAKPSLPILSAMGGCVPASLTQN